MSQQKVETVRPVRISLAGRETRRHRTLEERILVRFPAVGRLFAASWAQLPPHSRLRRALLARRLRQGYAAANRRDFDLLLTGLDPAMELHRPPEALDMAGIFYGHAGYREVWRQLLGSFEDARLDPDELLDFGDRFLVTVKLNGHAAGTGLFLSQPLFQLFTLRRGLIVRQDDSTTTPKPSKP